MKTTNLEEMRIAMETYYEEVCAPWSMWMGRRLVLVLSGSAQPHAEVAAAIASVDFSPCTKPDLGS